MDDKRPTTCAVEGCTELPFYQPAETGGALCPPGITEIIILLQGLNTLAFRRSSIHACFDSVF